MCEISVRLCCAKGRRRVKKQVQDLSPVSSTGVSRGCCWSLLRMEYDRVRASAFRSTTIQCKMETRLATLNGASLRRTLYVVNRGRKRTLSSRSTCPAQETVRQNSYASLRRTCQLKGKVMARGERKGTQLLVRIQRLKPSMCTNSVVFPFFSNVLGPSFLVVVQTAVCSMEICRYC